MAVVYKRLSISNHRSSMCLEDKQSLINLNPIWLSLQILDNALVKVKSTMYVFHTQGIHIIHSSSIMDVRFAYTEYPHNSITPCYSSGNNHNAHITKASCIHVDISMLQLPSLHYKTSRNSAHRIRKKCRFRRLFCFVLFCFLNMLRRRERYLGSRFFLSGTPSM